MSKTLTITCPKCKTTFASTLYNTERKANGDHITCDSCGFVGWLKGTAASETEKAQARNERSRSMSSSIVAAPVAAPAKTVKGSHGDSSIPPKVRSELHEIYLNFDDMTPEALHAELTSLLGILAPSLPENLRPLDIRVLDKKLDTLLSITKHSRKMIYDGLSDVRGKIEQSADVIRKRLEDDRNERSLGDSDRAVLLRELRDSNAKLAEMVAVSAEKAGETFASSPAVQGTLGDRLAEAVRGALDSRLEPGRELRIDQVLELFDTLDIYRNFWERGRDLTPAELGAKDQVAAALAEIGGRMDHWAENQGLEPFPRRDAGSLAFEETWYRQVKVEITSDPSKGGCIARVERLGYKWQDERLRKADVVVYKYVPLKEPVAASSDTLNREPQNDE